MACQLPTHAAIKCPGSRGQCTGKKNQSSIGSLSYRPGKPANRIKEVQQSLKTGESAVEFIRFEYYHKGWTDSVFYAAFIILFNDTLPHFVRLCNEKQLAGLLESNNNSSWQFVSHLYRGTEIVNNKPADNKKVTASTTCYGNL
jgi:hypothetical protein